jgi:membrane protease YdiL (CAAX protease family)
MLIRSKGFAEKSRSMASRTAKRSAWLDIVAMTAVLLSYLWIWQRTFPGELYVCVTLVVGLAVWSHWRRGETPRDLGFRTDNLVPAAVKVFSFVGPLIVVTLLAGVLLSTFRVPTRGEFLARLIVLPLFGLAQQYLLLGFYLRRYQEALPGDRLPVLATTLTFALLHLPNGFLVGATFLTGLGSCWLYARAKNLWVLGLAHGLLSLAFSVSISKSLASGMKVGSRALRR